MRIASSRFNNDLRYRDASDPAQVAITPPYLIEPLRALLGEIALDPCSTPDNPLGATTFYFPPADGLSLPWDRGPVYCNPPYGKAREPWVHRCIVESASKQVVLLMPAATDTLVFQRAVDAATSVLFVRGRLKFGVLRPNRRQAAASHPSAVIGFNVDLSPLRAIGLVMFTQEPTNAR